MKRILLIALSVIVVLGLVIRFGFPFALHEMGLHPAYHGTHYSLPGGKALIISTSHDTLGDTGKKTGVFGSELTAPYYEFLDNGMQVDIASIKGGEIPFDPISFKFFVISDYDKRYLNDPVLQEKTKNSLLIDNVDFTQYDIVFLAGGWGAAYDLGTSDVLGKKMTEAYAANKVIGGICHGPLGLIRATNPVTGKPLVEGRHVTAVTNKQIQELGIEITPLHPETELRKKGAIFESNTAFRDFFADDVVIDDKLVTGQNQNAGPESAHMMMKQAGGVQQ